MKKFKTKTIDIYVKTIHVAEVVWDVEGIHQLLKQIEKETGFKGFKEIHFKAGDYPTIVYYVDSTRYMKLELDRFRNNAKK